MAEGYLALDLLNLEDSERTAYRRAEREELREVQDPLDLTDTEFRDLYRINSDIYMHLVEILEPHLEMRRISGLTVEKQKFAEGINKLADASLINARAMEEMAKAMTKQAENEAERIKVMGDLVQVLRNILPASNE
ncbi:uncharacterized protein [Prorops nasuta]|uniref:uncharacterized protein n=1 Tax=Prorops nasuta TaxID=863751 RepID=UPI0034CE77F6